MSGAAESALAILVPEAEPLREALQSTGDPPADAEVPAHITLLYPFLDPAAIDRDAQAKLKSCFSKFASFDFALTGARRFPAEILYLAPEPDEPFRQLTMAIWALFPDAPPYGGRWPGIVPHLSLARFASEEQYDRLLQDFARASAGRLPIPASATEVTLLDNASGRWRARRRFPLGYS